MSITLKHGRLYRTRKGNVVAVSHIDNASPPYIFETNNGMTFTASGSRYYGRQDDSDLVEEVEQPHPPRMAELRGFDFAKQPWAIALDDKSEFYLVAAMLLQHYPRMKVNYPSKSYLENAMATGKVYLTNCSENDGNIYASGVYIVKRESFHPSVTLIKPTYGDVVVSGVKSLTIEERETENQRKKREILEQIAVLQKQAEGL